MTHFRTFTAAELADYKEPELVVYSGGARPSFDMQTPEHQKYWIELSRCNTPEKLLDWVLHLSGKTWVTTTHIRQLIRLAEKHAGIRIHYGS